MKNWMIVGLLASTMLMGCSARVKVGAQVKTPEPAAQPEPAAEEPKEGEAITLPDQIEFELDQARIKQTPKTLSTLQQLADLMKSHPRITKLRIEGHTDDTGSADHNAKLSNARAKAVAKWLEQHDVPAARLTTTGYGAARPLESNASPIGRAKNRRTEYYVEELDGARVPADSDDKAKTKVAAGTPAAGGKSAN
jgi:OmpA-OmpF porin, OOP family